jgi:hypothetical protein
MKKNNYLTLGGLFAALHLLFVFMSKIFVGSEFILVVFLPLLSTIYALKFNIKETIMFFIASFFLCVVFEPIATFIYVLPALLCGTIYGGLRKKKVKELSLVYLSSMAHSLSLLISFLFIGIMFKEVDFFSIFASFINKEGRELYLCIYLFLILLGVLEAFVTHIITSGELKRLGYMSLEKERDTPLWMNVSLVILFIAYIVIAVINPLFSCYALPFVIAFSIPNIVDFVGENKKHWIYFIVGALFFCSLFLMKYIDLILYPMLLILVASPLIIANFFRVLYTNSIKYSNNGQNKIE